MNRENQSEAIESDLLQVAENLHKEARTKYSMDTNKLVVGQKLRMQAGSLSVGVTVTEITEKYIQVEPVHLDQNEREWMMLFNKQGKLPPPFVGMTADWAGFGMFEWYPAFGGWLQEDPRSSNTEFGLWELTDSWS